MPGHFACIGVSASNTLDVGDAIEPLMKAAQWTARGGGGRMGVWRDPSGTLMSFNTNRIGSIQCCTPGFDGAQRQRVRPTGILKDPECAYCDMLHVEVLGDGDQMCYPLALQVVDIGTTRDRIPMKSPVLMTIAAFAEEITVWADDAAHRASQDKEPKFASESLIPSGLFGPAPHPHAMITGHVVQSALLRNQSTGGPFNHMVLRTFGGTYDVLAPVDLLPQPPAAGSVVQGSFWMVGRVIDGLQAPQKKKRFGFFGR